MEVIHFAVIPIIGVVSVSRNIVSDYAGTAKPDSTFLMLMNDSSNDTPISGGNISRIVSLDTTLVEVVRIRFLIHIPRSQRDELSFQSRFASDQSDHYDEARKLVTQFDLSSLLQLTSQPV